MTIHPKNVSIHLQRIIILCYTAIIKLYVLEMDKNTISSNIQSYLNFFNEASKLLWLYIVVLGTIIQ